jgi:hypothetical protein
VVDVTDGGGEVLDVGLFGDVVVVVAVAVRRR